MNINRDNYEIYLIDYFDGRLTSVEIADLMIFLSENPDIEKEFQCYREMSLEPGTTEFRDKDSLLRTFSDTRKIDETNFAEFCIASYEGDLDDRSRENLFRFIEEHPQKKNEYQTFQQLKLIPDLSICYPDTEPLRKKERVVIKKWLYYPVAVAAACIIAFVFFYSEKKNIPGVSSVPLEELRFLKEKVPGDFRIDQPVLAESDKKAAHVKKPTREKENQKGNNEKMIRSFIPAEPLASISPSFSKPEIPENLPVLPAYGKNDPVVEIPDAVNETPVRYDRFNLLSLAEAGIKGVNYLTESDIRVEKKVNDQGKVTEFGIELQRFGFITPIKK